MILKEDGLHPLKIPIEQAKFGNHGILQFMN